MGSTTPAHDQLIGDHSIDAYFVERKHFQNLGKNLAEIIANSVSYDQLDDIKTQLLMLAVKTNKDPMSTHSRTLLAETIAKIHDLQRKR